MTELTVPPQVYARGTPRLKAFIRDLLIQGVLLLGTFVLASMIARGAVLSIVMLVGLIAFFLYEPLLITWRGATIGQRMMNLRVVRVRDLGRVSFPRALLRTFVKATMGIPAFVVMYFTARRRALHDLAAGTAMIPYDGAAVRPGWFAPARWDERIYRLPHPMVRFVVTFLHWVGFFIIWQRLVFNFVQMSGCGRPGVPCRADDRLWLLLLAIALWAGFVAIAVSGANGHLWGARRRLA